MKLDLVTFQNNINSLDKDLREEIENSEELGQISLTKSGNLNLTINSINFHSAHDPLKESERLISGLKQDNSEKLYIFFGAGLGYSILKTLENPKINIIWMECTPSILKKALSLFDYSNHFQSGRLRILLRPFTEDKLFTAFKGLSNLPTSFIPHRPSLNYKNEEYSECKFICEKFFHKKDVNIATLSRFEKIWTRNILQNIPEISKMSPVSILFNLAQGEIPIVVAGAGPSLFYDIENIKKYRNYFILITVDTALHVLSGNGIEPDLIYSVDPQFINKSYLEGYHGKGALVFDPTSTFHTLRLDKSFLKGFFTSSPFPLFKIYSQFLNTDAGEIPFGGSVSTNAVSLAELMGASDVLFVGQDLAFTDGFAHCKGAILEERLNYKETRTFRREYHNHKQLFALRKLTINSFDGKDYHTNEKMQIFRKWFEDRANGRNWLNLTSKGGIIKGIPKTTFEEYFSSAIVSEDKVQLTKMKIHEFANRINHRFFDIDSFKKYTKEILENLNEFKNLLNKGKNLSQKLYDLAKSNNENSKEFNSYLKEMERIDENVSSQKGLNEIIGLGVQRVILMITENYDNLLSLEEKKKKSLSVTKKSILLYEGLYNSTEIISKLLKKALIRIHLDSDFR
ncbi:MAG: motility associated factor glycosyltransferase family protein [Leptospiraceae bacterium]|nr:motility associated factor glycosyltransferase family protein [Leptospiraceae bacterium]